MQHYVYVTFSTFSSKRWSMKECLSLEKREWTLKTYRIIVFKCDINHLSKLKAYVFSYNIYILIEYLSETQFFISVWILNVPTISYFCLKNSWIWWQMWLLFIGQIFYKFQKSFQIFYFFGVFGVEARHTKIYFFEEIIYHKEPSV